MWLSTYIGACVSLANVDHGLGAKEPQPQAQSLAELVIQAAWQ